MKINIKNPKAFSLIELSIVILIVGIVIAGVTQSSRLIGAFKLSSARNITQSSPVASIKGLILWLEPTMEASFISSEADDETNLSTWYDINPQTTSKINFTRTASSVVTYESNASNNLPGIEFSGTGTTTYLTGSTTAPTTDGNALTIFVVAKTADNSSANWRAAFVYGGLEYQKKDTNKHNISFAGINDCTDGGASWTLNTEIASIVYYGSNSSNTIKLYVNGSLKTLTPSTSSINTALTTLYVSKDVPWSGTVSEVIVFDRVLKIQERYDIEAYLSKKYGIAVTQAN